MKGFFPKKIKNKKNNKKVLNLYKIVSRMKCKVLNDWWWVERERNENLAVVEFQQSRNMQSIRNWDYQTVKQVKMKRWKLWRENKTAKLSHSTNLLSLSWIKFENWWKESNSSVHVVLHTMCLGYYTFRLLHLCTSPTLYTVHCTL